MSSDSYVKSAFQTVEAKSLEEGEQLTHKAKAPLPSGHCHEVDVTDLLRGNSASWCQNLIGILNWIVELGRINICNATARLLALLANPREGHLKATFHTFSHLKNHD